MGWGRGSFAENYANHTIGAWDQPQSKCKVVVSDVGFDQQIASAEGPIAVWIVIQHSRRRCRRCCRTALQHLYTVVLPLSPMLSLFTVIFVLGW